jgi:thermosome
MLAGQPILILKEGTKREKGRSAQLNNIAAAKAVADSVRTTMGPKGMDKMLVDTTGDAVITNDGATILKEMDIEHPAAKMLVEVAKTQDEECGDGTTTAVVLTGEFLKRAEEMIEQNIHPTIICDGFRMAAVKSQEILEKLADPIDIGDKDTLIKIAKTAMYSKAASVSKDILAQIAVEAVTSVAEDVEGSYLVDLDNIQVVKKHGRSLDDTQLIKGIILDSKRPHPRMPMQVNNAKIALINSAFEIKKTQIDANIKVTDPFQLQAFLAEEERMLKSMVKTIKDSGANVVFCQKGMDDLVLHYFVKEGIHALKSIKESDMEKLSKATGASIIIKLDDIKPGDLGESDIVEEKKFGEDDMTFVTGCRDAKAVSILIRGGSEHIIDEAERSLEDALHVVAAAIEDRKMVTGGGSPAAEIALRLKEYATSVGGREQMAIEAYASAMEILPRTLAENAGFDPINTLIQLRKAHADGKKTAGINIGTNEIVDMRSLDIIEPLRVSKQAINSATDVAIMILRIDDVIAAKGGGKKSYGEGSGYDSNEE